MSGSAPRPGFDATPQRREEVLDWIRAGERFILVTHENADGDALGSLIAMHGLLTALGKDSVMFMAPDEFPLPDEYRFFRLDAIVTHAPEDVEQRRIVFLDCGNIDRNPAHELFQGGDLLNLDHHHDNTRFGTLNYVAPQASCTAEIVWDLMHGLGVTPSPPVAEALYVGLITDTGRFMYENTGRRAHEMAAELIDAGVDVQAIYRRLYEDMPLAKLALLARALVNVSRHDDGAVTFAYLTAADFAETGAEESYSEGIVDNLRAVQGTKVAALSRELTAEDRRAERKVSLRATDDDVDVSAIARAQGGGGHRRAAGFSTDLEVDELVAFLRRAVADQLGTAAGSPAPTAA